MDGNVFTQDAQELSYTSEFQHQGVDGSALWKLVTLAKNLISASTASVKPLCISTTTGWISIKLFTDIHFVL